MINAEMILLKLHDVKLVKKHLKPTHLPNLISIYNFLCYANASILKTPSRKKVIMQSRIKMLHRHV